MVEVPPQETEWTFPKKVISYPTVSATYNAATYYYSATRGYNRVTEFTASCAERAAGAVAQPLYNASLPVLNRFEPRLKSADKYATEGLEKLEERAPLIKEEPGQIYLYARDATVSSINNSYVGQAVNYALQPVLKVAETFTPKPSDSTEEPEVPETDDQPKGENEEVTLQQTVRRAYKVGTKLQQRALERAMENVSSLRKRSQESLDSLRHAVDLIQYAKSLETATGADKLREFFNDIFEDEEREKAEKETEGEKTEEDSKADVSRKTLIVSRNLTRKLKGGYEATMSYAKPYLNEALYTRLQHGQTLLEGIHKSFNEAHSLKDVSEAWIETTKANLDYLSKSLKDVSNETLEYLGSWLTKKDNEEETPQTRESGSVSSYTPSESLDEDGEQKEGDDTLVSSQEDASSEAHETRNESESYNNEYSD